MTFTHANFENKQRLDVNSDGKFSLRWINFET